MRLLDKGLVDPFVLCSRHPHDSSLLLTDDSRGLMALRSDECKAVVLKRRLPDDVAHAVDKITLEEIKNLHTNCGQFKKTTRFDPDEATSVFSRRNIFNSSASAEAFGRDVTLMAAYAKSIAENYDFIYSWFHGHLKLTPKYHVDTIDVVRLATVYSGVGLRIIAGDVTSEDYEVAIDKKRLLEPIYVERTYRCEVLDNGDILAMKSKSTGGLFGGTQSLVHCSVAETQGRDRIFQGTDLYKPVLDTVL